MGQGKKSVAYKPFYPTTIGTDLHDLTFQKQPAFSIHPKTEIKIKNNSPGPGAYPKDDHSSSSKKRNIPKSLYPGDHAHKYTFGVKGKELAKFHTPGPATYPLERNRKIKNEVLSIYPKENANKFSIGVKRPLKSALGSPGPASYPIDADKNNINSLHPKDKANKFTMCPKRSVKIVPASPGPGLYPCIKKDTGKYKVTSIYPNETQLPATIKHRYDVKNKQQSPAPNTYPMVERDVTQKKFSDPTKKMIFGKSSPLFSLGIKHSPKQHILILNDDQY